MSNFNPRIERLEKAREYLKNNYYSADVPDVMPVGLFDDERLIKKFKKDRFDILDFDPVTLEDLPEGKYVVVYVEGQSRIKTLKDYCVGSAKILHGYSVDWQQKQQHDIFSTSDWIVQNSEGEEESPDDLQAYFNIPELETAGRDVRTFYRATCQAEFLGAQEAWLWRIQEMTKGLIIEAPNSLVDVSNQAFSAREQRESSKERVEAYIQKELMGKTGEAASAELVHIYEGLSTFLEASLDPYDSKSAQDAQAWFGKWMYDYHNRIALGIGQTQAEFYAAQSSRGASL